MNNDLGKFNSYLPKQTRDTLAIPADGASQHTLHGPSGKGPETRRADGDSLNLLLANRLLSALPAEDFARLFPHLEPVSLAAGETLYKFDQEMRYAYFPETAVVSHLYILSEGGMTEADMVGREGMAGLSAVFNVPPPSYLSEVALSGSALRARVDVLR